MKSFKARESSYTRGCKIRFSITGENGRHPNLICQVFKQIIKNSGLTPKSPHHTLIVLNFGLSLHFNWLYFISNIELM